MDQDRLKKILPFLKDVDLNDEKTRRKAILYSFLGVVFVVVFLILPALRGHDGEAAGPAGPQAARSRNLLEVADGIDRDKLPDNTRDALDAGGDKNVSIYGEAVDSLPTADDDFYKETKDDAGIVLKTEQQTRLDSSLNNLRNTIQGKPATETKPRPTAAPTKKKSAEHTKDSVRTVAKDTMKELRRIRRSGGVSTLEGEWSENDGVSSLRREDRYVQQDDDHLYKVMFTQSQKLRSGEKLYLRLLEDLVLEEGILIPRNTHVAATCRIEDRLQIVIAAIEVGGRTYKMNYVAYDNDGSEGLYCPETSAGEAAKIAGETAQNIGQAAIGSRLSNIASQVFSAGARIVQNKTGERSVSIDSGYEFYILKVKK